jgi:hypothetical protein
VKISEAILSQGAEAASLAATQAVIDAHGKASGLMMQKVQSMYSSAGLPNTPPGK